MYNSDISFSKTSWIAIYIVNPKLKEYSFSSVLLV